jgi:hypothetical protein
MHWSWLHLRDRSRCERHHPVAPDDRPSNAVETAAADRDAGIRFVGDSETEPRRSACPCLILTVS